MSAKQAAKRSGLSYQTFIRRAKEFGIYTPNQCGKGVSKPNTTRCVALEDIFNNARSMTGRAIKRKMLTAELLIDECSLCKIPPIWNGKTLTMQLDHIDGNNKNNSRENLRLLCPNCHTQTDTYAGKNVGAYGNWRVIGIDEWKNAIEHSHSVEETIRAFPRINSGNAALRNFIKKFMFDNNLAFLPQEKMRSV